MKNQTIQFRLSEEEKNLITQRAGAEGLTTSDYCRTVLTGFVIRLSPNAPTIAMPINLKPPKPPSMDASRISTPIPTGRGLPTEMLKELKTVLTKYYVE